MVEFHVSRLISLSASRAHPLRSLRSRDDYCFYWFCSWWLLLCRLFVLHLPRFYTFVGWILILFVCSLVAAVVTMAMAVPVCCLICRAPNGVEKRRKGWLPSRYVSIVAMSRSYIHSISLSTAYRISWYSTSVRWLLLYFDALRRVNGACAVSCCDNDLIL